ncbi:hypothetical protein [Halobaculum marinum]|uniref:Uncharacterized protein n=1 Tax=Halobaculum marinum TaxID=3031996 RepID=A0ABD5WRL0_9EURY|nr:hypothetical protein [Halobaculum sp. DT55]
MTQAARAVRHAGLHALHHLTVFAGICAFPFVLLSRQVGIRLPIGGVVARIHDAYDAAVDAAEAATESERGDEADAETER